MLDSRFVSYGMKIFLLKYYVILKASNENGFKKWICIECEEEFDKLIVTTAIAMGQWNNKERKILKIKNEKTMEGKWCKMGNG